MIVMIGMIFFGWFVACLLVQLETRLGKRIAQNDQWGLFPAMTASARTGALDLPLSPGLGLSQ